MMVNVRDCDTREDLGYGGRRVIYSKQVAW